MGAALTTKIPIRDRSGNVVDEKEVATYAGLLARAHEEGLKAISVELVQVPGDDNGHMAIAKATVETDKGKFTGLGDASPDNVNRRIAPHIIRMAETRAKARALRDATNIGVVALEELGDLQAEDADASPDNVRPLRPRAGTHERPTSPRPSDRMTEPQRKLLYRLLVAEGHAPDQVKHVLMAEARVERLEDITKRQASQLIDELRAGQQAS